ncbi:hypothetical protein LZC95_09455 [Pendulispora brunnea]|uniref:Uncharacterized protein n=1 Tax=Pendulispora brunnea TaxID=2905690 RepID=A0ABZ2KJC3_9BACT
MPGQGAQFKDVRPIVLSTADKAHPWAVAAFNASAQPVQLTLSTAGQPSVVEIVEPATVTVPAASETVFVISVSNTATVSSDQLVLSSSDGSFVRRDVSVVSESPTPMAEQLHFVGWHLIPFTSMVRIEPLNVGTGDPGGGIVGFVGSPQGGIGTVVRSGDDYSVRGITGAGTYEGSIHARPDVATKVEVHVRDAPAWPLIVLVCGLLLVGSLDRFNKRDRPRQQLRVRLAAILERGRQEQAAALEDLRRIPGEMRPGGITRMCDATGGAARPLLLDREVTAALKAYDDALDDTERARWQPGGKGLEALDELVRSVTSLHRQARRLAEDRVELLTKATGDVRRALENSPTLARVAAALAPADLLTEAELVSLSSTLIDAADRLARMKQIYDQLQWIGTHTGEGEIRDSADRILQQLTEDAGDLESLLEDAEALRRRSDADPRRAPVLHVVPSMPVSASRASEEPEISRAGMSTPAVSRSSPGSLAPPEARRGANLVVLAGLGLAVGAAIAVAGVQFSSLDVKEAGSGRPPSISTSAPPDLSSPPAPTASPQPTATPRPRLPDAPVTAKPSPAPRAAVAGPSSFDVMFLGGLAPVAVLSLFLYVGFIAWRNWRRTRDSDPALPGHASLTLELLRDQRMFDRLSALLVVLAGMSVLYFPNPSFGSLGDYATMLLWGTGVGEAVQLARRLVPSLPS